MRVNKCSEQMLHRIAVACCWAHWHTKENKQKIIFFCFVRSMDKMAWDGPKQGQEDYFPTNPDLADILGRTDLDFDIFYVFDLFASQISRFLGSQNMYFTNIWISRLPKIWISRLPNIWISWLPKSPHGSRGANGPYSPVLGPTNTQLQRG